MIFIAFSASRAEKCVSFTHGAITVAPPPWRGEDPATAAVLRALASTNAAPSHAPRPAVRPSADPATNVPGAYFAPPLRPGSSHRAIASLGDPRRAATA